MTNTAYFLRRVPHLAYEGTEVCHTDQIGMRLLWLNILWLWSRSMSINVCACVCVRRSLSFPQSPNQTSPKPRCDSSRWQPNESWGDTLVVYYSTRCEMPFDITEAQLNIGCWPQPPGAAALLRTSHIKWHINHEDECLLVLCTVAVRFKLK